MASYVVMQRRSGAPSRPDTTFVRDEFSFPALIVPLVWLVWHRLWFAALMLLLVSAGIGMAGEYIAPGAAMFFAGLVVSVYVALEGPAWRLARFRRLGYSEVGAVIASNLDDAEIRWFAGRGAPKSVDRPRPAAMRSGVLPPPLPPQSDMLFGYDDTGR